ncbi:DUF418 domain-containing protein [Myceligenerans crystallogenes]|uniref:DUF418 domain-containing protein n=2 Tax=Myceligenerans crystallogenes TaxID=316335 RepID=A0ABP4ZJ69_9MICO
MLLLIAVANTPFYLWGRSHTFAGGHPAEGSWLDMTIDFLVITVVDLRTYPMFAFLFGYGMWQIYSRQTAAGTPEAQAHGLLQLRNLWLLVLGFVHAALLWMGDVLGAYGIAGLIMVWLFLRRKDRTLIAWAWVLLGLLTLTAALAIVGGWFTAQAPPEIAAQIQADLAASSEDQSMTAGSYLASIPARLSTWVFVALGQGVAGLVVPLMILLAFWAGRRRILETPGEHLPLLRRVAAIGIPVAWAGALPQALMHVGAIDIPRHAEWMFMFTQITTGLFGGLGYVALFGLIGHAVARRRSGTPAPAAGPRTTLDVDGPVAGAIQAVGKRSLTCYLLQSVLCAPVLTAWGLGLGQHLTSSSMLLYAIAVWGLTLAFAVWQEKRGLRGPAEVLLRRLTYRRAAAA